MRLGKRWLSVVAPNGLPRLTRARLRLEGKNLAYDVRTLKGELTASGIEGTLFIDGSSGYCDPATTGAIRAIRAGRKRPLPTTPRSSHRGHCRRLP